MLLTIAICFNERMRTQSKAATPHYRFTSLDVIGGGGIRIQNLAVLVPTYI